MTDHPIANPFNNGILPDAWTQPVVDVPAIHGDVSGLCLELLDEVARHRKRRSILIHGAAGSGKTHTLARLRSAAIEPRPLFSYVRLTTSPGMIRRHLRHCFAHDLARKDERGVCHLEALLLASLAKDMGAVPDRDALERFAGRPGECGVVGSAFDETCGRLGLDFHVACALRLFLQRRHRPAVVHWLRTGELPDDVRADLGCDVGLPEGESVDPEHAAFGVVLQLVALATDTRPLLLCFDQLEAMQIAADDRTGYFAYGKLAADLFDHCAGLLLVTCMQTAALHAFRQVVPAADLDRIAQHEKLLAPLTEPQARDLIRARLDASPTLRADRRRRHNPLWPIDEDRLRQFLVSADRTPRRLCALGREAFATAHRMPADIEDFLSAVFEERRAGPLESTTIGDEFVHGLAVLLAARGFAVTAPDDRRDVDLVVTRTAGRLLISVVNDEGSALAHRLKQIVDHPPAADEERILVRDARRPIPTTARKSWEYWSRLAGGGEFTAAGVSRVRLLAPTAEAIASLEAVRSIMSEARAGDLEAHGDTVAPAAVEAWIRSHLRDEGLERLAAGIVEGVAPHAGNAEPVHRRTRDAVLEIIQRRHVMPIDDLALAANCAADDVRAVLAEDTSTFGTLGSPPLLVFDRSIPPR